MNPSLAAQINAATRSQHTQLNRLLIHLLPSALPPHARHPALFAHGLAAFARIFYTFEAVWREISNAPDRPSSRHAHEDAVRVAVARVRMAELERTSRLRADLTLLAARTGDAKGSVAGYERLWQRRADELLVRPHLLLAYGWVMYMAVFSGGRWIRQELARAGSEFWDGTSAGNGMAPPEAHEWSRERSGFSFLFFDTADGEHMKEMFRLRFAEAETLLTKDEREDVVAAAMQLFDDCIALVKAIDRDVRRRRSRLMISGLAVLVVVVVLAWWLDVSGLRFYGD